jgi:concanavalin A-like lectin/glucanase superfamily protein
MGKRLLMGLALTSVFLVVRSADAVILGHWKFDEASGATTALGEGGGPTGTIGSSVTTGVAGIAGNAYQFAGDATVNGVVDFGNATSIFTPLATSKQLTMSAWFNWTDNTDNRRTAVSLARTTTNNLFTDLGVSGSGPGFNTQGGVYGNTSNGANSRTVINTTGLNDGGTLVNDAVIPEGGGTPLDDGAWHHVVMTVDGVGGKLELYSDGASVGSVSAAITLPAYNDFEVGRLIRLTPTGAFIGLVDDVQIYNQILSPSDITFMFQHPGMVAPLHVVGDADSDGFVTINDYLLIQAHSFTAVTINTLGDVNGDSFVDFKDFQLWKTSFPGGSGAAETAIANLAIPEPATAVLGGIVSGFLLLGRRRRSQQ